MFFNLFKKFISKNDEKILKEQVGPAVTVIAPGTEIKGEIKGQDTLRISGYLVKSTETSMPVESSTKAKSTATSILPKGWKSGQTVE
jgi:hypothetical protein